jgi:hypothetical protein
MLHYTDSNVQDASKLELIIKVKDMILLKRAYCTWESNSVIYE